MKTNLINGYANFDLTNHLKISIVTLEFRLIAKNAYHTQNLYMHYYIYHWAFFVTTGKQDISKRLCGLFCNPEIN